MPNCKDCSLFMVLQDTEKTGVGMCTMQASWELVSTDSHCDIEAREYTCGDCLNFEKDTECSDCSAEDSAYFNGELCFDFVPAVTKDIWDAVRSMQLHKLPQDEVERRISEIICNVYRLGIPQVKTEGDGEI